MVYEEVQKMCNTEIVLLVLLSITLTCAVLLAFKLNIEESWSRYLIKAYETELKENTILKKRFKDCQKAYTKARQELAQINKEMK